MLNVNEKHPHKHRLKNGLEVLLIHSRSSPVLTLQGWIRYGAADESDEIAGIAHLFEHLLFKGTEKRAVGRIAQEIESLGGDLNAYTTYDHTVMHMTLASKYWERGLDILSDALLNSVVSEDELSREKPVILEEIKRRNDVPGAIAGDLFRGELFRGHPYARPVIGYSEVVAEMPRERIMSEYRSHYTTDQVFLVLCGDFDENVVLPAAEKYFAGMKSGGFSRRRPSVQSAPGRRSVIREHETQDALLHIGWTAPNLRHKDTAALDALALVLGQGDSSRLVQRLIYEKQWVRSVGTSLWSPLDDGSFTIGMKAPKGIAKIFPEILTEIDEQIKRPVTSKELEKAKKNLLSSSIYARENVDGLAEKYAYFESIAGDFMEDEKYLEQVRSLTTDRLEEVKQQYIKWDGALCGGIIPQGDFMPQFEFAKKKSAIQKPAATKTTKSSAHGIQRLQVNGLTVILRPLQHLPMISLRWVGWGGQRLEPSAYSGLGALWARAVTNGGVNQHGRKFTREEFNQVVDDKSASISAFHGRNSWGFHLDCLKEDFPDLLDLLLAAYCNPSFDREIVEHEKKLMLQDLQSAKDRPTTLMGEMFHEAIFTRHPYARPTMGTPAGVKQMNPKLLADYHRKMRVKPQVLAVTGDIEEDELRRILESAFTQLRFAKTGALNRSLAWPKLKKSVRQSKTVAKEQSHLLYGFQTTNMFHKDHWALTGLSALLSGMGGRLFNELREKMSLCYTVAPSHMEGVDAGYFSFYIGTSPEKVVTALEAMKNELRKIRDHGIPQEEWQNAFQFVVGNHEIEQQSFGAQAIGMALDELYGEGAESYFNFAADLGKIGPKDLQNIVKKYLDPDKNPSVLTIVGPKVENPKKK
jgi:zinc protease